MRHKVQDSVGREITFDGEELAFASSWRRGKMRWIELKLYRTDKCVYVLAARGMTRMDGESEHHWVYTTTDPMGVLTRLHRHDDHQGTWLTFVASQLLARASAKDDKIAGVYRTFHVS